MQDVLPEPGDGLAPAPTAAAATDMQNDFCAEGGGVHRRQGDDDAGAVLSGVENAG